MNIKLSAFSRHLFEEAARVLPHCHNRSEILNSAISMVGTSELSWDFLSQNRRKAQRGFPNNDSSMAIKIHLSDDNIAYFDNLRISAAQALGVRTVYTLALTEMILLYVVSINKPIESSSPSSQANNSLKLISSLATFLSLPIDSQDIQILAHIQELSFLLENQKEVTL